MKPEIQRVRSAWESFVRSGEASPDVVRSPVRRAWERCRTHGVDARAMSPRWLSPAETVSLLEAKRPLIEAALPYMHALSVAAGTERHAAMLGDERGIVLDIVADEETAHRTPGFPTPGSVLSEDIAGANGIGSPLAEDGYAEFVGPEHYIEGFHVYTCQGLPLRGPEGETVGVLSTSVRRHETAERLHEILLCAAHGIEAELTHRRLTDQVAGVLKGADGDRRPLEELRQDVTQLQAAARLRLERAARLATKDLQSTLGLVAAANELIARYRRHSELWRDLAAGDVSLPRPIDLRARLKEIAELVSTEAAVRGVTIEVEAGPPVLVTYDPRELTRQVFRLLLRGLEHAVAGHRRALSLAIEECGASAHVRSLHAPEELTLPLVRGAT